MLPEPETTGRGKRAPNLPQGSSAFVTPGGQTLYPGDTGGGGFPWDTTSGLGSLIQQIAGTSSGPASAFGLNDLGSLGSMINDIVSQLGPPSQDGKGDLTKLLDSMFQMPVMNQYSGNFGSRQNDAGQIIADYAAQLHSIGDPTHGRVPGTSTKSPNIPTPADFAAHARALGAKLMKQWTDYELQAHDPNRGSPIDGGPHPKWWSDDTATGVTAGAALGAAAGTSPTITSGMRTAANAFLTVEAGTQYGLAVGLVVGGIGAIATKDPVVAAAGIALGGMFGTAAGLAHLVMRGPHHFFFPSDEGGGGPRSNPNSSRFMPDPETGSGGGPRGYSAMPDPETGNGGGPRGDAGARPTGFGSNYLPNPEDSGGGSPRT